MAEEDNFNHLQAFELLYIFVLIFRFGLFFVYKCVCFLISTTGLDISVELNSLYFAFYSFRGLQSSSAWIKQISHFPLKQESWLGWKSSLVLREQAPEKSWLFGVLLLEVLTNKHKVVLNQKVGNSHLLFPQISRGSAELRSRQQGLQLDQDITLLTSSIR